MEKSDAIVKCSDIISSKNTPIVSINKSQNKTQECEFLLSL